VLVVIAAAQHNTALTTIYKHGMGRERWD